MMKVGKAAYCFLGGIFVTLYVTIGFFISEFH